MHEKRNFSSFVVILLMFAVAACQPITPVPPTQTQYVQSPTETQTPTPLPSSTSLPTPTPSPAITSTPSLTPTPTSRWDDWQLSFTPLPPINEPIQPGNIEHVQEVAVWGTGRANHIEVSPDGRILAVGTNIGAFLYDTRTYELLNILETPFAVQTIAFSSNNRLLALGQTQNTIDLFERGSDQLLHRFSGPEMGQNPTASPSVSFSPDNTRLNLVTLSQGTVYINSWDVKSYQPTGSFTVDNGRAAFINPATNLIGVIHENSLNLQSLTEPEEMYTVSFPKINQGTFWDQFSHFRGKIIPSSDGTFIILNDGYAVIQWEILADEISYRLDDYSLDLPDPCMEAPDTCRNSDDGFSWVCEEEPPVPPIATIGLSPENFMVLVSLKEGRSEFRRAGDGFLSWEIDASFTNLAFSPTGEYFFGIRPDGTIEKRATLDGSLINSLDQHPDRLYDLAFSPDNSVLAAGFSDGWIRVYSAVDGQFLGVLEGTAKSLQFSPDGLLLAAGLDDGTVRVFELAEGRYENLRPGHLASVTDIDFSADGQKILTASDDCTAAVWDVALGYRTQNLPSDPEEPFRLTDVAQSADTLERYFVGNLNGIVAVQDDETRRILLSNENGFSALALSPNGQNLVAIGSLSWIVPVGENLNQNDTRQLGAATPYRGIDAEFTPDGGILILANEQQLQFWSPEEAELLSTAGLYTSPQADSVPAALEISSNGLIIALGSQEGFITLYAVHRNPLE